jgi:hypothetical protein
MLHGTVDLKKDRLSGMDLASSAESLKWADSSWKEI